jgi:phage N-6-adenine-methyltransferase
MEVEWYTPAHILERVRTVLGNIDLDPASSAIAQQRVQADRYFTEQDDGLAQDWSGKVFCNPPYDQWRLTKFTNKFVGSYFDKLIEEGIMLTNSGTDTTWNTPLSRGVQVYTNGRIEFLQPCGNPKAKGSRGQLFTYFGPHPGLFIRTFCDDGFCWMPNRHLTPY